MTKKQVEKLFTRQWEKAQIYLKSRFPSLNQEQCDDLFCDSMELLMKFDREMNLHFDEYRCLEVYFKNICIHKAQELIKSFKKIPINDKASDELSTGQFRNDKIDAILELGDSKSNNIMTDLVHFVRSLPEPCDTILWGYYVYEETLKELASELDITYYKAVKKKKECVNKFTQNCPRGIKEAYYEE